MRGSPEEVFALASRLAKVSTRMRAVLAMRLPKHVPEHEFVRYVDELNEAILAELEVDTVAEEECDAAFLRADAERSPREALRLAGAALRRPDYIRTPRYRDLQAWQSRNGLYRPLASWAADFIGKLALRGVPIFLSETRRSSADHYGRRREPGWRPVAETPACQGFSVEVSHAIFRLDVPPICFRYLHVAGRRSGRRFGLPVRPESDEPGRWTLRDWPAVQAGLRPEDIVNRRQPSRPPTEEWDVAGDGYGITK